MPTQRNSDPIPPTTLSTLSYDQWRMILRDERLPLAIVDLEAFDRNVAKLANLAGSKRLRLATKSVRVPDLIRRALARGAPYQGLLCYSAEEAGFLAEQGFDDLLVAYPTVQAADLRKLREAHERGARVAQVVDSVAGLRALATGMRGTARPFPVVGDVDVSLRQFGGLLHLGVRRSPIRGDSELSALLDEASKLPELRVLGAMAYEAQVAGLGDRNPFKRWLNPVAALVRWRSVGFVARRRAEVARLFRERGVALELFNGGGTGSVTFAAGEPSLTELSAGSGLLCPHLFDYYSNVSFEPACFFGLQVTRVSDRGYATCQSGGYVASGEPGWDRVPLPYLPAGMRLVPAEGAGEVQTPVRLPPGARLAPGDPVLFRHAKAGELAERFQEYLLVAGGKIVGRAKTYRGFGRSFG